MNAQWAKTVTGGNFSVFKSIAVDASGNIYAAGYMGIGTCDFGNGVTAIGTYSGDTPIIVKYNSNGNAQWAKTVTGLDWARFTSIAVDTCGNIYGGMYLNNGTYNFGNGVTVTGPYSGTNPALVKYDSNGKAQWAKTVTGTSYSIFFCVAVDANGNVYAGGYMNGTDAYGFGNGVSATANFWGVSAVLIKYDSNGNAQWAKTVNNADRSRFNSIAVDANGSIYAGGSVYDIAPYDFGNGVIAAGAGGSSDNPVLVKYDSDGNAQWARTVTSGMIYTGFYSVATDVNGNVYVGGAIGNSVHNLVLIKYDSNGNTQWTKTAINDNGSNFSSVAADVNGNIYACGDILGTGTYDFGNGVTVTGPYSGTNPVLVKYNSNGNAQWAKTVTSGSNSSAFISLAFGTSGNVYAGGFINGASTYGFGNGVTADGTAGGNYNVILVKYEETIPIVSTISKFGTEDTLLAFSMAEFTSNFSDSGSDSLAKIKIVSLPSNGVLKLSGIPVTVDQEIAVGSLDDLTFVPTANWHGSDSFSWSGSDGTTYSASAAKVNIAISAAVATKAPSSDVDSSNSNCWIPWVGGIAAGVGTTVFTGGLVYLVNKYCHHAVTHSKKVLPNEDSIAVIN